MKIPEQLRLPSFPLRYNSADYEADEAKNSVAAAFFAAEAKHGDDALKRTRIKVNNGSFHEYSDAERLLFQTEYEAQLRPKLDQALQKAILANDGVVTAFPSARWNMHVTLSQTSYRREQEKEWEETDCRLQEFDMSFDYFRGVEREADIPYTSYYSNPTAEKLVAREAELKERMVRVLNRGKERLKKLIGAMPTILALGLDVLLVYLAFSNRELYLSLSNAIPFYEFCSRYGSGLSFVHLIGLPLLSLFLSIFLTAMLDPVVVRGISKKQAVAEYEAFASGRDYLEAKQALEEERPRYDRLMMDFYTAWYRHSKGLH